MFKVEKVVVGLIHKHFSKNMKNTKYLTFVKIDQQFFKKEK